MHPTEQVGEAPNCPKLAAFSCRRTTLATGGSEVPYPPHWSNGACHQSTSWCPLASPVDICQGNRFKSGICSTVYPMIEKHGLLDFVTCTICGRPANDQVLVPCTLNRLQGCTPYRKSWRLWSTSVTTN